MVDIEKVIKALENCENGFCRGCTEKDASRYRWDCDAHDALVAKALKLLKEHTPKTGRWLEKEDCNMDTYYDCSVCGESWVTIDGTPWQNGMNYCPHCGAKMET